MELVSLTDSCRNALRSYLHQQNLQTVLLNLKTAGCTGFQYQMNAVEKMAPEHHTVDLLDGYSLQIPMSAARLLEGTVIDYVKTGLQSRYVYHNPNARATCGCGESFYG